MYSPTTCSTSLLSCAGYVYCCCTDGVRKQEIITPLSGRSGYVPGTLRTIDCLPWRVAMSQSRGSRIAVLAAVRQLSYEWSWRVREAEAPEVAGGRPDDQAD